MLERMGDIEGTVLTFDALHAVHESFEQVVVEKNADSIVQVKNNTPALAAALEHALRTKPELRQTAETFDGEHGRFEHRKITMVPISPVETSWPHTHVACRVDRHRQELRRGEVVNDSHDSALYVGTFSIHAYSVERVLRFIREHWGVENELHHPKDRSMDEDRCRASESGIGRVMSCIRSLAAQISRRTKESLSVLRCRFGKKTHLLLKLLFSCGIGQWERHAKPYKLA